MRLRGWAGGKPPACPEWATSGGDRDPPELVASPRILLTSTRLQIAENTSGGCAGGIRREYEHWPRLSAGHVTP